MSRRAFLQSLAVVAGCSLLPAPLFAETPLERALNARTQLEFVDTPLKDVFAYIGQQHGFPVRLLKETYDAGYLLHSQGATFNARGITLRSALNLLVDDLGLDYCLTDRGEILVFAADRKFPPVRRISREQARGNERNRRLLEEKIVTLQFVDTPFRDVIAYAADYLEVMMVIDYRALEAIQLQPDAPISLNIWERTLHRAMTAMLLPYDLGVTLRDEVLYITRRDPKAPRRPIPEDLKRAALAPVEIQLLNPTLQDALAECCEQAQVGIWIDHRRVERAGIKLDQEVIGPQPKMPLRDVLEKILTPLRLQAAVIDGVLFVTPLK